MREIYRVASLELSYSAYFRTCVLVAVVQIEIERFFAEDQLSATAKMPPDGGKLSARFTIYSMIPFAEYAARVQEHLERDWGIPVVTRDIPDPLTGDLDGAEIDVDYAITPEQRLFLLGHLFGHTVQWNVNESAFDLGRQYKPPVDEALFPEVLAYEGEAARYGLSLLHQIGIMDVDQWFSNYTAADQAYLLHFYRTGDKGEFKNFWREDASLLEPKAVPPFKPKKRVFRMDGVVI
jgi:hypothetical protein